jgi:hypothetical protein
MEVRIHVRILFGSNQKSMFCLQVEFQAAVHVIDLGMWTLRKCAPGGPEFSMVLVTMRR